MEICQGFCFGRSGGLPGIIGEMPVNETEGPLPSIIVIRQIFGVDVLHLGLEFDGEVPGPRHPR